jgi:gamma-glutamyltranspeptidase / glutathione hydrolase
LKKRGVVAAGHAATAGAAASVLADGGNAVDAALAALCAACVAEPVLASLGGGGFLLVHAGGGRYAGRSLVYDFFVQTPGRRHPPDAIHFHPVFAEFGPARQEFHIGLGATATPGVVRGLFEAHRDAGSMPMRDIVRPAIELARDGVVIDSLQAYIISVVQAILTSTGESRRLFASPAHPDLLVAEGDRLRLPEFADVLDILAIEGDDLFYRGEIAQRVVAASEGFGGHLSLGDLKDYRVERRRPLAVEAFGAKVLMNPPPSTGGILIAFALELLRTVPWRADGFGGAETLLTLARVMAATNRARTESGLGVGDIDQAVETLKRADLVERYRNEVLGRPTAPRGTTHISVIDKDGMAASLSISNGEGCGHVIAGTGIMLNNMLGEEDINAGGFHKWPGNVRMSSMMTPTVVAGGDGALTALGSGGSNRIRTAILQVLVNLLVFRMHLPDAVDAPRLHNENGTLSVEPGFDEGAVAALAATGATVERWPERNVFFGGVHAARREVGGGVIGAGDPRRGGQAMTVPSGG